MYNGSNKPPISSSKLIIIMLAAIVLVMLATVALNGGTSAPPVEENNTSDVDSETNGSSLTVDSSIIGNNSYGTVVKSSGYGNPSSDIHVAFIVGVDAKRSQNSIVPTLQNEKELNYCYDIYVVDTSTANNDGAPNNQSNMTVNQMSENLASEYVVPDVINNNYNFTVDVHSTNDSNSYVFVPSDNTYTSKKVMESIVNNTNMGTYTPDKHSYTEAVSETIIDYEIPSMVYVTRDYYSNGTSGEVSGLIHAIDNFDFVGLFSSDNTSNGSGNMTSTNNTDSGNMTSTNNNDSGYTTINVSSNSSGNKEV